MFEAELVEVHPPARMTDPDAAQFVEALEVGNAVERESFGTDDISYLPAEELPRWHDPHEPHRMVVARLAGRIVGVASSSILAEDDADIAWLQVQVLPEFRRRGIGTALADTVEGWAVADGKHQLIVYAASADATGGTGDGHIPSPTGFGSVPAANAEVRFLLGRGYTLEQVERASRLPLPVPDLEARLEAAAERSGSDYRVHTWVDAVPERWREDVAVFFTRMSTDEPTGGIDEPEDVWTVARLVEFEEREKASPRTRLAAAVEHIPTGRLVGLTDLTVPAEPDRAVAQQSTIVLPEHRGHRLGMLLKVANLTHLQGVRPGHPSIVTFNAEENRFMLSTNEAVGFVPLAYEGAWRKKIG